MAGFIFYWVSKKLNTLAKNLQIIFFNVSGEATEIFGLELG